MYEYLSTGNLDKTLDFFRRNNDPEVDKEFNGVTGEGAFTKILEFMGVPVPLIDRK